MGHSRRLWWCKSFCIFLVVPLCGNHAKIYRIAIFAQFAVQNVSKNFMCLLLIKCLFQLKTTTVLEIFFNSLFWTCFNSALHKIVSSQCVSLLWKRLEALFLPLSLSNLEVGDTFCTNQALIRQSLSKALCVFSVCNFFQSNNVQRNSKCTNFLSMRSYKLYLFDCKLHLRIK